MGIVWIAGPETKDFPCIPMEVRDRGRDVSIRSPEEGVKNGAGRSGTNVKSSE